MSLFPWDFRQASILRRFFENTQGRLRGSSSGRGRCRRGLWRESQGRFQEAGLSAFFREPRTVVAYSRMVHPRLAAPALCVGIAAFPRVQPRCGSVHRRDSLAYCPPARFSFHCAVENLQQFNSMRIVHQSVCRRWLPQWRRNTFSARQCKNLEFTHFLMA